jgi:hypothetical protein
MRQFRNRMSDATETDDAHRQATKLHQREIPVTPFSALCPFAVAHSLGVVANAMSEFEQQREGGLCDGFRAVGRDVRDRNTSFLCGDEVHHVCARRQHADVFQIRQLLDMFAGENRFVGQDDLRGRRAASTCSGGVRS